MRNHSPQVPLVSLRQKQPTERILISKANVSDAFRNVRVDPDQALNFCYTVKDLVAIDFWLTLGWSGSQGYWGFMAAAAERAQFVTPLWVQPRYLVRAKRR